jgi:hypothetical protein
VAKRIWTRRDEDEDETEVAYVESSTEDEPDEKPEVTTRKRKAKKQRLKRGYAPPEVYAHLNYVQDCLDYELNSKQARFFSLE